MKGGGQTRHVDAQRLVVATRAVWIAGPRAGLNRVGAEAPAGVLRNGELGRHAGACNEERLWLEARRRDATVLRRRFGCRTPAPRHARRDGGGAPKQQR